MADTTWDAAMARLQQGPSHRVEGLEAMQVRNARRQRRPAPAPHAPHPHAARRPGAAHRRARRPAPHAPPLTHHPNPRPVARRCAHSQDPRTLHSQTEQAYIQEHGVSREQLQGLMDDSEPLLEATNYKVSQPSPPCRAATAPGAPRPLRWGTTAPLPHPPAGRLQTPRLQSHLPRPGLQPLRTKQGLPRGAAAAGQTPA